MKTTPERIRQHNRFRFVTWQQAQVEDKRERLQCKEMCLDRNRLEFVRYLLMTGKLTDWPNASQG